MKKFRSVISLLLAITLVSTAFNSLLFNTTAAETTATETAAEEVDNSAKLTAFSGEAIWVDTAENPDGVTSALSLVKVYKKTDTKYRLYLPETANIDALPVYFSGYSSVKIGNYDIVSGNKYSFTNLTTYPLYLNGSSAGSLNVYQSDSPAMYLNTKEPLPITTYAKNANGESIENKDNFETKGTLATSELGKGFNETTLKKIKGRGNASWSFSYYNFGKYSYNITLDSKTKLYSPMAKGKKFCLLANNGDEALLRNLYTFLLADKIGSDFTPRFQYVELYDNGDYMGSFLLTDKVEINSQSVDLSCNLDDLNELANEGVDLADCTRMSTTGNINDDSTAGYKKWVDCAEVTTYEDGTPFDAKKGDGTYLLELEMKDRFPNEISGFISNKGQHVVVKTPEFASKDQVDFASSLYNRIESVVYNPDSTFEDLNSVIDVDSFIKVYFIQELSKNIDSCQTSYYLYYDSKIDGRLHAAPVWDYDMAYGQYATPRVIAKDADGNDIYGESAVTSDWHSKIKGIYKNEAVLNIQAAVVNNKYAWSRAKTLWNGENGFYNIANNLLNGSGEGTIPWYIEELRMTAKLNESRWEFIQHDLILSAGLNDTGDSYEETTAFFRSWTTERLNWMNDGSTNTTPLADLETAELIDLGSSFSASIKYAENGALLTLNTDDNSLSLLGESTAQWNFEQNDDGSYQIYSNGLYLEAGEGAESVYVAEKSADASKQNWYLYLSDGQAYLVCQAYAGYALTAVEGGVCLAAVNGIPDSTQLFTVSVTGQNMGSEFFVYINSDLYNKPITVASDFNVVVDAEFDNNNRIWKFIRQADGTYKISPASNSEYFLTVSDDGSVITSNEGEVQYWNLLFNTGSYILTANDKKVVVDVAGAAAADGTDVVANAVSYSFSQYFSIEKLSEYSSTTVSIPDDFKNLVFDAQFYSDAYADLKNAFGTDETKLYQHFINSGIKEGRCASPYFDLDYYIDSNPDIKGVFGSDKVAAFNFFIDSMFKNIEVTRKLSLVLDINYYRNRYPDLSTAFASSDNTYSYLNHFYTFGRDECRQGSEIFDPVYFRMCNSDIGAEAVNYAYYSYMVNYIKNDSAPTAVTEPANIGDGFFATITNKASGMLVTVSGSKAVIEEDNGGVAQLWYFSRQEDGRYRIASVSQSKYLDLSTDTIEKNTSVPAALADKRDAKNQSWFIYYIENRNAYALRADGSPQILEVTSTSSGTSLSAFAPNSTDTELFTFTPVETEAGEDFYATISPSYKPENLVSLNGNNLRVSSNNGSASQVWRFEMQDDGTYKITNSDTGLCMDAAGDSAYAGYTIITTRESNDSDSQRWLLVKTADGRYYFKPISGLSSNYTMNAYLEISSSNLVAHKADSTDASLFYINPVGCSVNITKTFDENTAAVPEDMEYGFTMNVYNSGDSENPVNTYSFSLKNGDTYTVDNLLSGQTYTICEYAPDCERYIFANPAYSSDGSEAVSKEFASAENSTNDACCFGGTVGNADVNISVINSVVKTDGVKITFNYYARTGSESDTSFELVTYSKMYSLSDYAQTDGEEDTTLLERLLTDAAVKFSESADPDNALDYYIVWLSQQEAETGVPRLVNLSTGELYTQQEAAYHTDFAGNSVLDGENWVNYYSGDVKLEAQNVEAVSNDDYSEITSVSIWFMNRPVE